MIGIEPTWIAPPDPKSGASASFATSASKFKGLRIESLKLIAECAADFKPVNVKPFNFFSRRKGRVIHSNTEKQDDLRKFVKLIWLNLLK